MYRELFELPFLHVSVKGYGFMLVLGFLSAMFLIRFLSRHLNLNPEHIINAALYSLISGIAGARIFYVVHYFDSFRNNLWSIFAVWQGGLELLGGVFFAITIIILYMKINKLPIRLYLDILAISLLLALSLGRVGCFLNGCCFGKPTESAVGVIFPYASPPYYHQAYPNLKRNRPEPYLYLPAQYYGFYDSNNQWYSLDEANKFQGNLKPASELTPQEKVEVSRHGKYHALAVHPTQLYSSGAALIWCGVLLLYWKYWGSGQTDLSRKKAFGKAGTTFAMMLILYGPTRFLIEFVRDDNPFEKFGLTISQLIGLGMFLGGLCLFVIFLLMKDFVQQNPAPIIDQNSKRSSRRTPKQAS